MEKMDFHSVMETFAEAWVAANTPTPLTEAAEHGLINGPSNNNNGQANNSNPPNTSNAPVSGHNVPTIVNHIQQVDPSNGNIIYPHGSTSQPTFTILQEPPKNPDMDNSRASGRQSPNDSQSTFASLGDPRNHNKAQDLSGGKCLPVHCIIEQVPGPQACGQYVELDSYAIIPCDTLFSDLVRTALGKLGYSVSQILGAKGSIRIKKWKPLAFDQITENPEATVGDILGDLTTMAILHVRLYSVPDNPQEWKDTTVRNAVLELLREMSQIKLAKLCPLSQPMLSNIINNRYMGKIGKEKCQEFGQWYLTYRKEHPEGSVPEVVPSDRPVDGRLTFHPTKELPLMRDWFHSCRNPSRRTLQMYVDILNQGSVRQQERPKVAINTLKNWWKNEKQRERKNQKSDDQTDEPSKPKRKKSSDDSQAKTDPPDENGSNTFNNSDSQDTPPKTNNKFTLINHSESESDIYRVEEIHQKDISENSLAGDSDPHNQQSSPPKDNFKFTLSPTDHEVATVPDNRLNGHIIHPILPMKDSIDSPFFHKLHPVCIDHPHGLFGFPDHNLGIPGGNKIFGDSESSGRTNLMEESNSHLSSEDDVDVGM